MCIIYLLLDGWNSYLNYFVSSFFLDRKSPGIANLLDAIETNPEEVPIEILK